MNASRRIGGGVRVGVSLPAFGVARLSCCPGALAVDGSPGPPSTAVYGVAVAVAGVGSETRSRGNLIISASKAGMSSNAPFLNTMGAPAAIISLTIHTNDGFARVLVLLLCADPPPTSA